MQYGRVNDLQLNNGVAIPQLGFGVWQVPDAEAEPAVTAALQAGYRSIDTAKIYGNEAGVGRALAESGLPREQVFVTTKLWNDDHENVERAFEASLERLGLETLDLYLMHWPVPRQDKYVSAWRAMERLYADGRVRAIGVSNFHIEHLTRLMEETSVVPALNQVELHPNLQQAELRAFHASQGILTEAWSPLGQGKGLLGDPALAAIGQKHGRSPAQVVLRWHIQLGNVVIPKSVTPARIKENIDVFDFALDDEDMAAVGALDTGTRLGPDPATMNWMG